MKDFIKRLNENFEKKRSYLEESISESEKLKSPEKPFSVWDDYMEDEDEANIDRLFHDADQDELIKAGAFDNLNLEEAVEDIDINYMTISDLLSNMHENVPEEFLDNEIKFFKKLAKVFDTKLYDEILVAVDDGGYDPKYVFSDGLQMPELGENVIYYPEANMIAENKYGNLYLYFVTEDSLKKYFAMAKKFLTDYEIDDNVFSSITEGANGIRKISATANGYHDWWELEDGYGVHNDGGIYHVIDENNGNAYLFDSQDINQVNSFIQRELGLDMEIEPSTRVFTSNVKPIDSEKEAFLKDMAKNDYEVGHTFDPYDFDYFKKICEEDGHVVTEDDFDRYFELLDEVRACAYDDDCNLFEDEE